MKSAVLGNGRAPRLAPAQPAGADDGVIPLASVKRNTLKDQSYFELRKALIAGRFEPGEQLTIRSLADRLGIGTMPVREAVLRLVAANAFEQLETGRVRIPNFTRAEYEEVIRIRLLLEPLASELAAARADAHALATIDSARAALKQAMQSGEPGAISWESCELRFHIYRASGARHLVGLIESIWLRSGSLISFPLKSTTPSSRVFAREMKLHDALVTAVQRKQPAAASNATREIIEAAAEWYRAHFPFEA